MLIFVRVTVESSSNVDCCESDVMWKKYQERQAESQMDVVQVSNISSKGRQSKSEYFESETIHWQQYHDASTKRNQKEGNVMMQQPIQKWVSHYKKSMLVNASGTSTL